MVVSLGDVRLSEKDANMKLKEYKAYIEKKKERCNLYLKSRHNNQYNQRTSHKFECKHCDYRTSDIRNWAKHRRTKRHRSIFVFW